jgi:hypothetical protein
MGKPEGRLPLGSPRQIWEYNGSVDNIKMDLGGVGWGMDCIDMAQDRDRWRAFVNVVNSFRVS